MIPTLHPNEEGPRYLAGKTYYWDKVDGRLTLRRWPDDENGRPVPYDDLPRGAQT